MEEHEATKPLVAVTNLREFFHDSVQAALRKQHVAVDDHSLDHLHYTDEDKSIADTGWWEEESRDDRRLVFVLHGREGSRRYALIQTDTDWLLHLTKDQPAD